MMAIWESHRFGDLLIVFSHYDAGSAFLLSIKIRCSKYWYPSFFLDFSKGTMSHFIVLVLESVSYTTVSKLTGSSWDEMSFSTTVTDAGHFCTQKIEESMESILLQLEGKLSDMS